MPGLDHTFGTPGFDHLLKAPIAHGEILRAVIEPELTLPAGGHPAADATALLEYLHRVSVVGKPAGGRETGESRADDRDALRGRVFQAAHFNPQRRRAERARTTE